MTPATLLAPAPWTLHGDGVVIIAHFLESFVRQHGFLADYQRDSYRGYIGAVVMVDYHSLGVGSYQELLFIPGLFDLNGQTVFSISKIYVSTYDSVWNGTNNWGIPKEQADFNLTTLPNGTRVFEVSKKRQLFFSAWIKPWSFSMPVTTKLAPGFRIMQRYQNECLLTQPEATGKSRLASLGQVRVDPEDFPDIRQGTILGTATFDDFTMTFPMPQKQTLR